MKLRRSYDATDREPELVKIVVEMEVAVEGEGAGGGVEVGGDGLEDLGPEVARLDREGEEDRSWQ
ncbi:hypothetical protein CRG98_041749 [Punica granatum]|uniref:Uncharacterized protein n=1 Tax=Punica granatum TaxID=22663 RepID=A0A2I0I1J7_PUNGR|nr:hypothetical protein CRG98_041749 [Punica granatum]